MEREYKDSGIEWIGTIPETWEVTKLLNVLKSPISDGPHETPSLVENGIPFISVDSLNDSDKVDLSVVRKFISYQDYQEYSKKSKIEKGDILFSKAATIGKTAIVGDETFMVWSPLAIIKTNNNRVNNKFIYHVLNCHRLISYISFLGTYNTQINVGMRALERAIIPLPPLSNQHRIADYLDEKCGEIDSLIALQEQMIEKLKAYKQSVITETVTKGLNPNAKLVPSGIDWIGNIPEGWEINKLFNLCTIKGRVGWKGLRSDEFKEKSYAYLVTGQDFVSSDINWINCYQIDKDRYEEDPYIQLSNGDILVTKDGTIGKIAKVSGMDKPACLNSGIFVLKQRKETFFQDYLYWYLSSPLLLRYNTFINTGGTTIIHLYQNVFERFSMIIPPMDEQIAIASYLDSKCSDIDRLIALKQQKIESLKDYKKSVIYEAVTGKTII